MMANAIAASRTLQHFASDTQCHKVLNHMIMKGSISPLEAAKIYGVERLTSRIFDIKRQGDLIGTPVVIKREMRADAEGKRYARYYLHNS